jgi:hypothetical protein
VEEFGFITSGTDGSFVGQVKWGHQPVENIYTLACKIIARSRGNFMLGYLCIGIAKT